MTEILLLDDAKLFNAYDVLKALDGIFFLILDKEIITTPTAPSGTGEIKNDDIV